MNKAGIMGIIKNFHKLGSDFVQNQLESWQFKIFNLFPNIKF